MRNKVIPIITSIVFILLFGQLAIKVNQTLQLEEANKKLQLELKSINEMLHFEQQKAEDDIKLGQYIINMMYITGSGQKLSNGKKQVLARSIVRVVNEVFDTLSHKHAFIGALAIESGYQKFAQSPTGPKGYSQLAKHAFHEGIKYCNIGPVFNEDVWETDLNLYAGACYFRHLLELPIANNDVTIAMVLYNRGPNDEGARRYAKTGHLDNLEALKYVAKASYLKGKVSDEKLPGIPSIEDINSGSK